MEKRQRKTDILFVAPTSPDNVLTYFFLKRFLLQGFQKLNTRFKDAKSFNLFIESKEAFEQATYILGGVLIALLVIGVLIDIFVLRQRRKNTATEGENVITHYTEYS